MTQKFNPMYELFMECKKQLPLLAAELNASNSRVTFEYKQTDDEEPEIRLNVNLSFGKYANFSAGSYVNLSHNYKAAEKTLREYHAKWSKEEEQKQAAKKVEEEKERVYQEYLKTK